VPQLDIHGAPLPPHIAKQLTAAGDGASSKWILDQQLATLFPSLDRSQMQGKPVTVAVGNSSMNFFNAALLPGGAGLHPVAPGLTVPRGIFGFAFPEGIQAVLVKAAADRGYKSRYWLSKNGAESFGTKIRDGEIPVMTPGRVIKLRSGADSTVDTELFNAEQTMHPELFTDDNCRPRNLYSLSRPHLLSKARAAIQAHIISNNLPRDTVWSTLEELKEHGIEVRDGAEPAVFSDDRGALEALYGESMTSDPVKVKAIAAANIGHY
jgi:hypothetical protein